MKRIAVLTGGGDAPGLNAVIRAVVKTAINVFGCEVVGVLDSYDGFIAAGGVIPLDLASVRGILPRGGTILGTANRGNPFARKVIKDGKEVVIDVSEEITAAIKKNGAGRGHRHRRRWNPANCHGALREGGAGGRRSQDD